MPWTMTAFLLASLSIAGLPPLGGLWSKWYLVLGTVESGQFVLLAVLLLSTLLNIGYLVSIPLRAFFRPAPDGDNSGTEAPAACLAAIGVTAFISVLLFVYPQPVYRAARALVE